MSLYVIESNKYIDKGYIPHRKEYQAWMNNLSSSDLNAIEDELNNVIDNNDVVTAGWVPGSEWEDTVYYPIYEACGKNVSCAGMFFGIIMFNLFNKRPEKWAFGRYEKDNIPIESMTYFKLKI